ncbi:winged helix-turn-helix transcriptional regulator [Microvirga aerilata]|uniref:Winged helix-turn-helix transcriptional regulator n=1 Tax=Microvirga aerilata TaxID=670292 RepID=A0A936Z771_9HYPH|nr:MarR family winged helix-turn-helix transcriptional regulator [Microvirga aerilata]MBL0403646.1 winged helix-turn-helix transcriptional regulator [Microvirga aerilata]
MHDDIPIATTRDIPDHCLGLQLQRAARVVARRFDQALGLLELTSGQFELLVLLGRTPAGWIGAVTERLGRECTTITAILKPLTQHGLVVVMVNLEDSRGRTLTLPPAGKDLLTAAIPIWHRVHVRMGTCSQIMKPICCDGH